MRTLHCEEKTTPSVIALGTFDGVHRGHRAVIAQTVALAKAENLCSVVYTFSNHPLTVFGKCPSLLTDAEEKEALLRETGCDLLVLRPFDADFASLSAEAFLQKLCGSFSPRHIVVGENYTFGKNRQGDVAFLEKAQDAFGFTLHVLPLLQDGELISSTGIRQLLTDGEVEQANRLLGRPYALMGEIVHGKAIGRTMGYPTINIQTKKEKLLPRYGVYAAYAQIGENRYPCVLNIGIRPTVNGQTVSVEAFLLHFSGEIYGETAKVALCAFLRPEQRFASLEELSAQIGKDVEKADALLQKTAYPCKISG